MKDECPKIITPTCLLLVQYNSLFVELNSPEQRYYVPTRILNIDVQEKLTTWMGCRVPIWKTPLMENGIVYLLN